MDSKVAGAAGAISTMRLAGQQPAKTISHGRLSLIDRRIQQALAAWADQVDT